MRTIKIIATNEDGELLDSISIDVADNISKLAVRPITIGHNERPNEDTLIIGTKPAN